MALNDFENKIYEALTEVVKHSEEDNLGVLAVSVGELKEAILAKDAKLVLNLCSISSAIISYTAAIHGGI